MSNCDVEQRLPPTNPGLPVYWKTGGFKRKKATQCLSHVYQCGTHQDVEFRTVRG